MRYTLEKQGNLNILVPEALIKAKDNLHSIFYLQFDIKQTFDLTFDYSPQLQAFLHGKQLLLEEIPFSNEVLYNHYLHGYIHYHHGIKRFSNHITCQRCGNTNPQLFAKFPCERCKQICTYCRNCINMGRVSMCTPLLTWNGPSVNYSLYPHELIWEGTLSPGQEVASSKVIKAVDTHQELLVWAVCGSGKTEILFKGIERALESGKRVCITTPRTDVIHELEPRLRRVFPYTKISSLYGGSNPKEQTQLVISTTHQLLRYYKAFDTIIIDEVDAFPYSIDKSLQYAVKKSAKDTSSIIYLTATPNSKMKERVRKNKLSSVIIPARYHRHPLPEPFFKWCGDWQKVIKHKRQLPRVIIQWLQNHMKANRPIFLFAPNIHVLLQIESILKKSHPKVASVHSEDPNRKEKVNDFRQGNIQVLVTTTILERGVTVPNIQVGVIGTEDEIFTESALVQIAGRAGRSVAYPTGDVTFFHYGITIAMRKAKNHIQSMNNQAKERGLIN